LDAYSDHMEEIGVVRCTNVAMHNSGCLGPMSRGLVRGMPVVADRLRCPNPDYLSLLEVFRARFFAAGRGAFSSSSSSGRPVRIREISSCTDFQRE